MATSTKESGIKTAKKQPERYAEAEYGPDDVITEEVAERIATARERYVGIHVISSDHSKWLVIKAGAKRAYGRYLDKKEAINVACEKRKKFPVAYVFVHDYTGRVVQTIDK